MGKQLTVGGNNSFLEPINEVTLDAQFGTTLKQAISTINDNFKKIISVPFLKGEHGENIELIKVPILHDGVFTKLGERVIKSIYETNATTYDPSLDNNFGGPVGVGDSSHSYDFMKNNCNEIAFYGYRQKTQVDEKIKVTSQQIFIFIDSRVGNIEDIESAQLSTFQDLSCALSITGDIYVDPETGKIDLIGNEPGSTTDFTVEKHSIIPTLYYDDSPGIEEWCWRINGQKTKITAQGKNGEDGKNSKCVVCFGNMDHPDSGNIFSVTIANVLSPRNTSINDLEDGQLAIVWYKDPYHYSANHPSTNLNCAFGSVETTLNHSKKIYLGHIESQGEEYLNYDLLSCLDNLTLRSMLYDICCTESTPNATPSPLSPRGIWVPDQYSADPGNAHMMYSDNNSDKTVNFALVTSDQTKGNSIIDIAHTSHPSLGGDTIMDIHYDKVKKDFIEMGRNISTPAYDYSNATIASSSNYGDSPEISSSTISTSEGNVPQYINVRKSDIDTDTNMSALTSKGLFLIGKNQDDMRSLMINSQQRIMKSDITIGKTKISIIGSGALTGVIPLSDSANSQNFTNSEKILVHNENVVFSNSSFFVGGNRVLPKVFNAYVQHYKNSMIFNYDYIDCLRYYANPNAELVLSAKRPRRVDYIPVSIGGWLTQYNSVTSTKGIYSVKKTKTIELSQEDNFKHTFMSGKFGWSATIETDGLDIQNNQSFNSSDSFQKVLSFSKQTSNTTADVKYGVITSVSGLWTKIGNVVDVKGKIFFEGAQFTKAQLLTTTSEQPVYTIGVSNIYPLTYNALFDFIQNNPGTLKFPLPVVLKKSDNNYYVSTGNIFKSDSSITTHQVSVTKGITTDKNLDSTYTVKNHVTSMSESANDILNGDAKIHFFGDVSYKLGLVNKINSGTQTEGLQVATGDFTVTPIGMNGIESLQNIFSCTANLRLIGNKDWGFLAIPEAEILNKNAFNTSLPDQSRYGNSVGPVRFSNGLGANATSYSNSHNYVMANPLMIGCYKAKDNDAQTQVSWDSELLVDMQNQKYNVIQPTIATTIAPYVVRYMTFQFSYMLDDDIYGNDIDEMTRNYDDESWPGGFSVQEADMNNLVTTIPTAIEVTQLNNGGYATLWQNTDSTPVNNNNLSSQIISNSLETERTGNENNFSLNLFSSSSSSTNSAQLMTTLYWYAVKKTNSDVDIQVYKSQKNISNTLNSGSIEISLPDNQNTICAVWKNIYSPITETIINVINLSLYTDNNEALSAYTSLAQANNNNSEAAVSSNITIQD